MSFKKYYLYKEQVSLDSGTTWQDTDKLTPSGDPIGTYETYEQCTGGTPEIQYRWTQSGTTCIGYDKYQNNIKEQSTDGGSTWTVVIPEEYSASTLIESQSTDCGYVPPTPTIDGKYKLTLSDSSTVSAECDTTSSITESEISTPYSGTVVSIVIGDCVTTIAQYAFYRCSGLTSIDIPSSVTSISKNAFMYCSSLTSATIPNSVTSIGNNAFNSCSSLTSATIPNSVTSIGYQAFGYCSSFTSVTIPDSVANIGDEAFRDCTSLTSITVTATTPPTLGGRFVFGNTNKCPIYVPSTSVNAYKTATNWSTYKDRIQAIP